MPSASTVSTRERIKSIDIIRGIALLGILIINFTVDDANSGPYDGWTGFGDQFVYWSVQVFLNDRFQSIYCFLFGLGFAIQMQRATNRNSFGPFMFLRRMIVLFLIGSALQIFTGQSFTVISYYAIVGVLLILFWKVPAQFLPLLAILFFIFTNARQTIVNARAELNTESFRTKTNVHPDTAILDRYVGVYQNGLNQKNILMRSGDSLVGENEIRQYSFVTISGSQFFRRDYNLLYTFTKQSSEKDYKLTVTYTKFPDAKPIALTKVQTDLQIALQQLRQKRKETNKEVATVKPTYRDFIQKNKTGFLFSLQNLSWQKFIWKGTYEVGYILVLFLLGLYAGKKQIFQNVDASRLLLRKIFKWGLFVGGSGIIINAGIEAWTFSKGIKYWTDYSVIRNALIDFPWNVGVIVVALAYMAGLVLLLENRRWVKKLSFFGTVGRMGLTSYSLHLVAYMMIFNDVSWFWGLEGKNGCLYRLFLAIPVYAIIYLFCRLWFQFFRVGPLEWLWHSITYLKRQPIMKKKEIIHQVEMVHA